MMNYDDIIIRYYVLDEYYCLRLTDDVSVCLGLGSASG